MCTKTHPYLSNPYGSWLQTALTVKGCHDWHHARKAWLQVLHADSGGILIDLRSSRKAPEKSHKPQTNNCLCKNVRNVQNTTVPIDGDRSRDQTLCTHKVRECKQIGPFFPANRTESYRVRSSPSVSGHGENCPRSSWRTRNRNWHAKTYRPAWSKICLVTARRTKDTKTSLRLQDRVDRMCVNSTRIFRRCEF